jgi:putative addiction module component (TIGR02574 family)
VNHKALEQEALKLSLEERVELAYVLFRSLDEAEGREIEKLWLEEAERRYQDYLDGKVEAVPGEKAIRRIRMALR